MLVSHPFQLVVVAALVALDSPDGFLGVGWGVGEQPVIIGSRRGFLAYHGVESPAEYAGASRGRCASVPARAFSLGSGFAAPPPPRDH